MIYKKDYESVIDNNHTDRKIEIKTKTKTNKKVKDFFSIKFMYLGFALEKTWNVWRLVFIFPIAISVFKILVCGVLGLCEFDLSDNLETIWLNYFFTGSLFDINAFRIHAFIFLVIFIWSYFTD